MRTPVFRGSKGHHFSYLALIVSGFFLLFQQASAGAPYNPSTGEQRTLVLLVNFSDNPGDEPFTVEDAQAGFFGTIADYYAEVSYGNISITGDVHGWLTLPIPSTCSRAEIKESAHQVAEAAGIDVQSYNRWVYFAKKTIGCFNAGESTITAYPSESVIHTGLSIVSAAHEFGHAIGLHHANSFECFQGETEVLYSDSDLCEQSKSDYFDLMGPADDVMPHFSAPNKERLGWLAQSQLPVVEQSGVYTISPIETLRAGQIGGLKILQSFDAEKNVRTYYYLEFRQPFGFDSFLATDPFLAGGNITSGVSVRLALDAADLYNSLTGVNRQTLLLDMTPGSDSWDSYDLRDVALTAGNSYRDASAGFTISVLAVSPEGAQVEVIFDNDQDTTACVKDSPDVYVVGSQSAFVLAGETLSKAITVRNLHGTACEPATFELSNFGPEQWDYAFAQPSVTLDSGQTATLDVQITPNEIANPGEYAVDLVVADTLATNIAAEAAILVTVGSAPDNNSAPTAVNDSAETQSSAVTIAVLENDLDADGDSLIVESVGDGNNGIVTNNGDGTVTYHPGTRKKKTDSFYYVVSDGQLTDTATVKITSLERSKGKGRKR